MLYKKRELTFILKYAYIILIFLNGLSSFVKHLSKKKAFLYFIYNSVFIFT